MDSNSYQNYSSPVDAQIDLNNTSAERMPPVAPSFRHSLTEVNNFPNYYFDRQTLDRLMDSVHQSRIEGIDTSQHAFEICIEDVHVVNGAIEIHARMVPESPLHLENSHNSDYLNTIPNYKQLGYSSPYQFPNQFAYSSPYQSPNQLAYSYPYQSPNQLAYPLPYQSQYASFNQGFPSQYSPQFAYHYPYSNQFPAQYLYQYPMASLAGSIIGAISRFALTTNLLRR